MKYVVFDKSSEIICTGLMFSVILPDIAAMCTSWA